MPEIRQLSSARRRFLCGHCNEIAGISVADSSSGGLIMTDFGRRIVVDLDFETALGETARALRDEGLQTIARIDIRDHFRRDVAHDFRRYYVIDAWSPRLAFAALVHDLDSGIILPTRLAIYELADGETSIVAAEPLASMMSAPEWQRQSPELAMLAREESRRIARVLERLQHAGPRVATVAA
jgi:uncharacterized protein (DUF302 family)